MYQNPKRITLYGIGSEYAHEAIEIAARADIEIAAFIDNLSPVGEYPSMAPVLTPAQCNAELRQLPSFIPLVTPAHRKLIRAELADSGFEIGETLIDPTAIVARSTRFGCGVQVNAAVVVGANCRFGEQVLVNRSVSIGHDADIDDYVSFGPGALLCGSCAIGTGAFIGGGATLAPGVHVGANAIVGAGAVVVKDVPANTVVAGNPAKVLREEVAGYNGVGV